MATEIKIREFPILFDAAMVRAVLSGHKTQTRRVIKPAPPPGVGLHRLGVFGGDRDPFDGAAYKYQAMTEGQGEDTKWFRCPYGVPGDRLWVRENWRAGQEWDDNPPSEIDALHCGGGDIRYEADGAFWSHDPAGSELVASWVDAECWGKQRPPIQMPRWASRIILEVVDVRVERVQEISEEAARAEGCDPSRWQKAGSSETFDTSKDCFESLWDLINRSRGFGWDANPWVWAVTFTRIGGDA